MELTFKVSAGVCGKNPRIQGRFPLCVIRGAINLDTGVRILKSEVSRLY